MLANQVTSYPPRAFPDQGRSLEARLRARVCADMEAVFATAGMTQGLIPPPLDPGAATGAALPAWAAIGANQRCSGVAAEGLAAPGSAMPSAPRSVAMARERFLATWAPPASAEEADGWWLEGGCGRQLPAARSQILEPHPARAPQGRGWAYALRGPLSAWTAKAPTQLVWTRARMRVSV